MTGDTEGIVRFWSTEAADVLGRYETQAPCRTRLGWHTLFQPEARGCGSGGGEPSASFGAHLAPITSLAFPSHGPTALVSAAENGELRTWAGQLGRRASTLRPQSADASTGPTKSVAATKTGGQQPVRCRGVAIDPAGTTVAVALGDGRIVLYRASDGEVRGESPMVDAGTFLRDRRDTDERRAHYA